MTKVGIQVKLIAVPESGERKRNLTTSGLGEKEPQSETRPVPTKVSESSESAQNVLVQLEALGKDVVANHNDHKGRRSEAPPGERKKAGDASKAGPATMTSRAMERAMGEGRGWGEVISCLPLVGGAKTAGGGVEARSIFAFMFAASFALSFFTLASTFVKQHSQRHLSAKGLVCGIGCRRWSLWPRPLRGLPGLPCHVRKEQSRVVAIVRGRLGPAHQ